MRCVGGQGDGEWGSLLSQSSFAFARTRQVFTEKERLRCRLDGGCEEDGRQRKTGGGCSGN